MKLKIGTARFLLLLGWAWSCIGFASDSTSVMPSSGSLTPTTAYNYTLYTSQTWDVNSMDNGLSCLPIPTPYLSCQPGFTMQVIPIYIETEWVGSDCYVSDLYMRLYLQDQRCPNGVLADASDYTEHGCDNRGIEFKYQLLCVHP